MIERGRVCLLHRPGMLPQSVWAWMPSPVGGRWFVIAPERRQLGGWCLLVVDEQQLQPLQQQEAAGYWPQGWPELPDWVA